MKNRFNMQIILLSVICFLTGCKAKSFEEANVTVLVDNSEKNGTQFIDDTYYVADVFGLLMLCEGDELPNYEENIQLLKGDKESVEKAIENLSVMEQTPAVLNAIGVGDLRLAKCNEGKEKLNEALSLTEDDSEKVCILNNLGNYRLYTQEDVMNGNILSRYEQALELESNPVKNIIIRMNKIVYGPLLYIDEEKPISYIKAEFEQLLKDEKKVLGSNQIVEIYANTVIPFYLNEKEEDEIPFHEQALKMNHERYQFRAADILIYQGLVGIYHVMGDNNMALEYSDELIKAVDGFLSDIDPYFIRAYYDKIRLLIEEKRYDEAIQYIDILTGREDLLPNHRMNLYLKLGEIHYLQNDFTNAEEIVQEAYDIFLKAKKEEGISEIDINEMLKIYSDSDFNHGNLDYMEWLEEQLENIGDK